MDLKIEQRVALVTGASQGIGAAIALNLAKEGVRLAITSNNPQNLDVIATQIKALNAEVIAIPGDARIQADINAIVAKTLTHYGQIDILVNNVGSTERIVSFEELADQEWFDAFEINLMSGVRFTQAALPSMRQQQWGRIVFMSSERAIEPRTEMPHYAMAKAAVLSITKSLANTVGKDNITVNSVSPGVIPTPAFDNGARAAGMTREAFAALYCKNIMSKDAAGHPNDVAAMVCFLCSEQARWLTGSNFRVDGGSIPNI